MWRGFRRLSDGGDGIFGESTDCLLGLSSAKGKAKGRSPREELVKMLGCGQCHSRDSFHSCYFALEARGGKTHTLSEGFSSSSAVSLPGSERGVARMMTLDAGTSCNS